MVRKSACVGLLQKKAVKLATLAKKEERHSNYERACEYNEEVLLTLATASFYNAESRDCGSRLLIRQSLGHFVNYLVEMCRDWRELLLKRQGGSSTQEQDRSTLWHLRRLQYDLFRMLRLNPATLSRSDEKWFIEFVGKKSKEFEDSLANGKEFWRNEVIQDQDQDQHNDSDTEVEDYGDEYAQHEEVDSSADTE